MRCFKLIVLIVLAAECSVKASYSIGSNDYPTRNFWIQKMDHFVTTGKNFFRTLVNKFDAKPAYTKPAYPKPAYTKPSYSLPAYLYPMDHTAKKSFTKPSYTDAPNYRSKVERVVKPVYANEPPTSYIRRKYTTQSNRKFIRPPYTDRPSATASTKGYEQPKPMSHVKYNRPSFTNYPATISSGRYRQPEPAAAYSTTAIPIYRRYLHVFNLKD